MSVGLQRTGWNHCDSNCCVACVCSSLSLRSPLSPSSIAYKTPAHHHIFNNFGVARQGKARCLSVSFYSFFLYISSLNTSQRLISLKLFCCGASPLLNCQDGPTGLALSTSGVQRLSPSASIITDPHVPTEPVCNRPRCPDGASFALNLSNELHTSLSSLSQAGRRRCRGYTGDTLDV